METVKYEIVLVKSRWGWYANARMTPKNLGVTFELNRDWWRPTQRWAEKAARRWVRKYRSEQVTVIIPY